MNYSAKEIEEAIKYLEEKYPVSNVNNNKSVGSSKIQRVSEQKYISQSMKRSNYKNIIYHKCLFENVAFTNSYFNKTIFEDCSLIGNSFACCKFINCSLETFEIKYFSGNNFSQSTFTKCNFSDCNFVSSGFLQTLFYNCNFSNICVMGSTLEGSSFKSCIFADVDMGNVNVEFIEIINSKIDNLILPFYQLPYIIGIVDYVNSGSNVVTLRAGEKIIEISEFLAQIDNLILYYEDKAEYFAICNLYIIKNNLSDATTALLNGINSALSDLDFRMIRHFCRLANRHDLLDEVTIRRITQKIENYLMSNEIPVERLNDGIIHAGEIRQILLSGKTDSVTLNLHIRTNVCKKNSEGMKYVNSLCSELNAALSKNDYGHNGFQIAVANHSPYEIVIDVICAAGALATIAQLIWGIVENHKTNKKENYVFSKEYSVIDRDLYQKYIDSRIEQCKEQLLNLKTKYADRKLNQYIEEITQKLKTDIVELYDKDIMIIKKRNKDNPK